MHKADGLSGHSLGQMHRRERFKLGRFLSIWGVETVKRERRLKEEVPCSF